MKTICQKCERIEETNDGLCIDCYSDLQVELADQENEVEAQREYMTSEECGHIMRVGAVACSVCAGEVE